MITKLTISTHATPDRGDLSVMDLPCPEWQGVRTVPFQVRRMFWITRMPQLARRGQHAHREGHQFMICPTGGIQVDSIGPDCKKQHLMLQGPEVGLHVPPMHWLDIRNISPKTSLVVLASNDYKESDYIRDYDEFLQLIRPV